MVSKRFSSSRLTAVVIGGSVQPTPAISSSFREWADRRGILFPKLEIATFKDGLRGMRATESLQVGEAAVRLPRSSALLVEPTTKPPAACPPDVWKKQPWYVKLSLSLTQERAAGNDSHYAGYISSLPPAVDLPFFWPPEDVEALKSPSLIRSIEKQKLEWEGLVDDLIVEAPNLKFDKATLLSSMSLVRSRSFSGPYIGSKLPDRIRLGCVVILLALANIAISGTGSIEQTLNAVLAVSSFNFLYELFLSQRLKVYLLAPAVDFMNHNCSIECDLSYDYFSDGYSVKVDKAYKAGEQVFVSYGKKSNDDLLQYFGFVESGNPYDIVHVEKGMLSLFKVFKEIAEIKDLYITVEPVDIDIYRTGFAPYVLDTLRAWIRETGLAETASSTVLIEFCRREASNLDMHSEASTSRRAAVISSFKKEKLSILTKCIEEIRQQEI